MDNKMKKVYYIAKEVTSNNSNDLKVGARIFLEKYNPFIEYTDENKEGPFDNLKELKQKSLIYKSLVKEDFRRAEIIFQDKYIIKAVDYIITPQDSFYSRNFMDLFGHTTRGNIKAKKVYGIHFFNPQSMKIKSILGSEDKNMVWKAVVKVFDSERNDWFEKESTFFPRIWSLNRLFHECDYAIKNKRKIGDFKYISSTSCGILVEIIYKNHELKSIYPIYLGV